MTGIGLGGGGPLQQVSATEAQAIEGSHDGIRHQTRTVRQKQDICSELYQRVANVLKE